MESEAHICTSALGDLTVSFRESGSFVYPPWWCEWETSCTGSGIWTLGPSWWHCLGRFSWCGIPKGSMSLGGSLWDHTASISSSLFASYLCLMMQTLSFLLLPLCMLRADMPPTMIDFCSSGTISQTLSSRVSFSHGVLSLQQKNY